MMMNDNGDFSLGVIIGAFCALCGFVLVVTAMLVLH